VVKEPPAHDAEENPHPAARIRRCVLGSNRRSHEIHPRRLPSPHHTGAHRLPKKLHQARYPADVVRVDVFEAYFAD
jgi:hypothetical protein